MIIPDKDDVSPYVKAMVEAVDKGVGKIMNTLDSLTKERPELVNQLWQESEKWREDVTSYAERWNYQQNIFN